MYKSLINITVYMQGILLNVFMICINIRTILKDKLKLSLPKFKPYALLIIKIDPNKRINFFIIKLNC